MNTNNILEIKNLSITFPGRDRDVHAVKEISFHLHLGEILGIVGESGSGKSVTGLAVMNLLSDKAVYNKESIQMPSNDAAMIFQYPRTSLNPIRTVGKQLIDILLAREQKMTKAEMTGLCLHWLERVQLKNPESVFNSYPAGLSGGMCQRVLISMALMRNPAVLIADEPTTALDVVTQKSIMQTIMKLKEESNLSILFITHDLALAYRYCDRVLVMKEGEIVESNTPDILLSNPEHPYTKLLFGSSPSLVTSIEDLRSLYD